MTSWHDDFKARVDYAARVISAGGRTSRKFDSTCENDDGDAVVAALVRLAERNERLRANLPRYICAESIAGAQALKGQDLQEVARRMRLEAKARFDAWLAAQDAKKITLESAIQQELSPCQNA